MSGLVVALLGLVGLFVGAAVWVVSTAQAGKRPLGSGPTCAANACGAVLPALGWLPIVGFLVARRCPVCGAAQPAKRVAFELVVAGYFALAAARFDEPRALAAVLVFAVPLLVVLLVDWWTRLIHLNTIYAGMALAVAFALADGPKTLLEAVLTAFGAVLVFAFFFVLAGLIYRDVKVVPFGLGDVYLAALIAAMVLYPDVVSALFLGMVLAALGSVFLLATKRVGRRDPIPYGPYLCAGALVVLVLGG